MSELSTALEKAAQPAETKNVRDLIARMEPELEKALPQSIGVERFTRTILTELQRTPTLYECDPHSLLGAMMLSAQLGLEPGPLGHVYLVPFKKQVTFIVGYKGMIDLAYRSGLVKDVVARTVYANDGWAFHEDERGDHYRRDPAPFEDRGEAVRWYARARLRTGGAIVQVIDAAEVQRAMKASPSGSKGVGPWAEHFDAMARKTAVRRLQPFLPQSPVWARAMERDEAPAPEVEDLADAES